MKFARVRRKEREMFKATGQMFSEMEAALGRNPPVCENPLNARSELLKASGVPQGRGWGVVRG